MSKQIKRIRHSHAHTQQQLLRLCPHSTCISNSPIHHTYASTPPQSERNTGIATLWGEWESRSERGEETKCTHSGAETKHSVQKVLSVCGGRVWIVFFFSFLLSFLCIFLLFLLHLVGNNHRQRQSTVASQREWVGVKFGGILHRLVTSAFSASRMHQRPTGKRLLPPLPAPVPTSPPPTTTAVTSLHDWFSYYKLLLLFMAYMYISIELLFKGFSCITSNLLGFYNFFVAFFKRF